MSPSGLSSALKPDTFKTGERIRTATAIPGSIWPGVRHDREGQATVSITLIQNQRFEDQSLTPPPPRFPLPTPPNSLSTLSFLANETRSPEDVRSRSHVDVEMSPAPPLTHSLGSEGGTACATRSVR